MIRYLSLISFCALFLIFASCEDKKKTRNIDTNVPADTVQEVPDTLTKPDPEKEVEDFEAGPVIVQEELIPFLTEYGKENPENRVRISTSFGDIEVYLYDDTPLHRANFIFLAKEGYFDGTFFHRIVEDFVIQGGNADNLSTSRKRTRYGRYLIPSEFEAGYTHVRGAFSAAKYSEQNVSKASSPYEFFIVQSRNGAHHLDNDHTVYGRVTSGMDVVDEIAAQETSEGDWPLRNIPIEVEVLE